MPYQVTFDQNSVILRVKILDSSVSTGAGKTGLASDTSGLIISTLTDVDAVSVTYTAAGTIETIAALGTYAAPTATKCRFKEVDPTNHPGIYELQLADARFSVTGAKSLLISISGAADAAQCDLVIGLPTVDLFAAGGAVAANLAQILGTALTETSGLIAAAFKKFFNVGTPTGTINSLPDAVAGATGGLFIAGTNAATTVTTALTTTFTGNLTGSVGSVATAGIAAGSFAAGAINAAAIADGAIDAATFAAGAIDAAAIATDAVDADALAASALAEIKTQAVAALNTDTYAEPGQGAPAATTTLVAKLGYLYKAWRNKNTQTASEYDLYADNGIAVDQKAAFSDDATTATRGKIGTGA